MAKIKVLCGYICLFIKNIMPRISLICIIGAIFLITGNINAQKSEYSVPFSVTGNLAPVREYVILPGFNSDSLRTVSELSRKKGFKDNRFAKMIETNITPFNSGVWEKTDQGRVWRVGITSKKAYSLHAVFHNYNLQKGCNLYLYNNNYSDLRGAFNYKNNNEANTLAIAAIPGDSMVIELDVPNEIVSFGELTLSKVGHDYINAFGKHPISMLKDNNIEACEIDINCQQGHNWQTEKKAVCKITINGLYCTGTLIATTSFDKRPYLITASHCVLNNSQGAAEAVFYFNFERSTCGNMDSDPGQTLSGSSILATTENKLDFALLKLNDFPPISYKPYFAGWDISNSAPLNGVVIHHPNGAGKKISFDELPLTTADFGENFDGSSHWQVSQYSSGATEPGSSGAPFFNTQHRIIGTLTGGSADCASPYNDYYSKISLAWDKYPQTNQQVKYWLDPKNTNNSYIDGFDPYGFNISNCDTAWNISKAELKQLSKGNLGNDWIFNNNASQFTQFAEKFYNPGANKLLGTFFNISKAKAATALSTVIVKVWQGDQIPEKEIYSKNFIVKNLQADAINFMGFDSVINVSGNFFIGYSLANMQKSDVFAVKETENRGNEGPSTFYTYKGLWNNIDESASTVMYTSLAIGITQCYGKVDTLKSINPIVYPNPSVNQVNFKIPIGVKIYNIECYNTIGQLIPISYQLTDEQIMQVNINFTSGLYILKIFTKHDIFTSKFIIKNK